MPIDPWMAALASFGGGMSAAAGPSRMPVGMGGAIGQGAMSGLAGYAQMQEMQQAERAQQLENVKLMLSLKEMKRAREKEEKKEQALSEALKNVRPEDRAFAMLDLAAYVKGQAQANAPLTKWQQAQHELDQKEYELDVWKTQLGEQPNQMDLDRLAAEQQRIAIMRGNLDLQRERLKKESGGEGGPDYGSGGEENFREILTRNELKRRQGQPLTMQEELDEEQARSKLSKPITYFDQESGSWTQFFPDIPFSQSDGAPTAGGEAAVPGTPAATVGQGTKVPGGTLVRTGPKPPAEARKESALQTMKEMEEILDQAGTEVTGPRGWIQDYTEPLKEAVGMEHDPTRPALMTRHSALKMTVAPLLQPGGNISDRDIEDVNKAIGNLPALLSSPTQAKDAFNTIRRVIGQAPSDAPAPPAAPAAPAQHPRAPRTAAAAAIPDLAQIQNMQIEDLKKIDPVAIRQSLPPDQARALLEALANQADKVGGF